MKKVLFAIGIAAVVFAMGCKNSTNPNVPGDNVPDLQEPKLAKVEIRLPETPNGRSVGLQDAIDYSNYFAVYFHRTVPNDLYLSADATIDEGLITIQVPVGTYDILLLAGDRQSHYSSPLLLASSYVQGREIVQGLNQIKMELALIDVDITAPDDVAIFEPFDVAVEVNTRNPFIELNSYLYVNIPYTSSSGSSHYFSSLGGNLWVATGPSFEAIQEFMGNEIRIRSYFYPFGTSAMISEWYIANGDWSSYDNDGWVTDSPLAAYFRKLINFTQGQNLPEIDIEITWPTAP